MPCMVSVMRFFGRGFVFRGEVVAACGGLSACCLWWLRLRVQKMRPDQAVYNALITACIRCGGAGEGL